MCLEWSAVLYISVDQPSAFRPPTQHSPWKLLQGGAKKRGHRPSIISLRIFRKLHDRMTATLWHTVHGRFFSPTSCYSSGDIIIKQSAATDFHVRTWKCLGTYMKLHAQTWTAIIVDGWPVAIPRQHGPPTRLVETGLKGVNTKLFKSSNFSLINEFR